MPYRDRATGQYPISRDELVAKHSNTSFPVAWDAGVLAFLDVDPVFPSPMPEAQRGFMAREIAPELTPKNTWEQRWELVPVPLPPPTDAELSEIDETWS
jgi:hypothetical protein